MADAATCAKSHDQLNSTVRDLSDSKQSVSYIPAARSLCN